MELFSSGAFPSVVAARRCSPCRFRLMSDVDAGIDAAVKLKPIIHGATCDKSRVTNRAMYDCNSTRYVTRD